MRIPGLQPVHHKEKRVQPLRRELDRFGADRIHIDGDTGGRRERFESERLRQLRPDRLELLSGEVAVMGRFHPDPAAHTVDAAGCRVAQQVTDIFNETALEHVPVVAFGGNFVVTADDGIIHGKELLRIASTAVRQGRTVLKKTKPRPFGGTL